MNMSFETFFVDIAASLTHSYFSSCGAFLFPSIPFVERLKFACTTQDINDRPAVAVGTYVGIFYPLC